MATLYSARNGVLLLSMCLWMFAQGTAPSSAAPPATLGQGRIPAGLQDADMRRPLTEQRLPGEPPLPFAAKWGTNGGAENQFYSPHDVALDVSGNFLGMWG